MAYAWQIDVAPGLVGADLAAVNDDAKRRALGVVAARVLSAVINVWPVATGKSIAGFRKKISGASWLVYNDVSYTPYVHNGLADRTAIKAIRDSRRVAREALDRILERERTVGARGTFNLTGLPRATVAAATSNLARAQAIQASVAIVAPLAQLGAVEAAHASIVTSLLQYGNFAEAVRRLVQYGQPDMSQKVRAEATKAGISIAQGAQVG